MQGSSKTLPIVDDEAAVDRPGSRSSLSLAVTIRRITEVSTLPQTALRVMGIVNDPDSGAHEIKDIVEADPAPRATSCGA